MAGSLLGLLFATVGLPADQAKRSAPAEVQPVVAGGIRYSVPHFGPLHGRPQNGGYVQARKVDTDVLLWDRMVYSVVRDDLLTNVGVGPQVAVVAGFVEGNTDKSIGVAFKGHAAIYFLVPTDPHFEEWLAILRASQKARVPVRFTCPVGSGQRLTSVEPYQPEAAAHDVFISRISIGDGALRVENEVGEVFEMDLETGKVKAVTKISARTALPY